MNQEYCQCESECNFKLQNIYDSFRVKDNMPKLGHPLTVESFQVVSIMAPLCLFLTPLLPSIGNDTIVKAMGTYKLQGDFPIVSSNYSEI